MPFQGPWLVSARMREHGCVQGGQSDSASAVRSWWRARRLTWAGKPQQPDAEGAPHKLMQLAILDTGGLVNLGTALTSRFQILARFWYQNSEPRERLHDYFPNLGIKPGSQF